MIREIFAVKCHIVTLGMHGNCQIDEQAWANVVSCVQEMNKKKPNA